MAYETKIPSTRYVCALANVKGQWKIQMRLADTVEAEVVVKDLSEKGIRDNVRSVLSDVDLNLSDFLVEQIVKDIVEQAKILIHESAATATVQPTNVEISSLEKAIDEIKSKLSLLEERINRIESVLEHRT